MEEWMEKYFGKKEPRPRKRKDSPWMWPMYIVAIVMLLIMKGCFA